MNYEETSSDLWLRGYFGVLFWASNFFSGRLLCLYFGWESQTAHAQA